jgi:hypothetical protein
LYQQRLCSSDALQLPWVRAYCLRMVFAATARSAVTPRRTSCSERSSLAGPAASRDLARMLRFDRHYPPVIRIAAGLLSRFDEKRRTQSSSPLVVSVLISSSNSSGSVGQSPRSSRRALLMALTQSRPAIGPFHLSSGALWGRCGRAALFAPAALSADTRADHRRLASVEQLSSTHGPHQT